MNRPEQTQRNNYLIYLIQRLPGLLLTALITAAAIGSGYVPQIASLGLGSLTLAILAGMLIGNTLGLQKFALNIPGIQLAKQQLLRLGIILYGFRLTFQQVAGVGFSGLLIDILTLSSTFLLACWLGKRLFHLDNETVWLVGAGSSICGAAAVLTTGQTLKADEAKITLAIATVVIFGTLALFIYPLMWPMIHRLFPWENNTTYGIYIGSTLHEVGQVVAAGHAISPVTENAAVITKMLRVMLLAPFLLALCKLKQRTTPAENTADQRPSATAFPWFALLFIVVTLFNSCQLLPQKINDGLNLLDNILLTMSMAALGLTTSIGVIKLAGLRPMLLGLVLFLWLGVGGGIINLLIQHFMH